MTRKRLFYDLETSMLVTWCWRTGKQFVGANQILEHNKIISAHWKWEGEDKVHHIDWGLNKQCDKKIVETLIKEFDKADEIVAHNGDRFDIKWVKSRAIYHGLEMRSNYRSIDTLKLAKSNLNLPSYSLKELCKYYGLPQKIDAGGIETWQKIQFEKDQEALDHLLFYGDGDIISLEAVFQKLRPYVKLKSNYATLYGNENFFCPECSALPYWNKTYTTLAGTLKHYMKCKRCNTTFNINNSSYQKYFQYKVMNGIK